MRVPRIRRCKTHPRRPLIESLEKRLLLATDTFSRIIADRLSAPAERDLLTFQLDQPRELAFTVDAQIGDDFNLWLGGARVEVLAPDGSLIQLQETFGNVVLSALDLTELGTYTVAIEAHPFQPDAVGDYELHIADLAPEPCDTITLGSWETGYIDILRQRRVYELPIGDLGSWLGSSIVFRSVYACEVKERASC